jgi:hypothetical protein
MGRCEPGLRRNYRSDRERAESVGAAPRRSGGDKRPQLDPAPEGRNRGENEKQWTYMLETKHACRFTERLVRCVLALCQKRRAITLMDPATPGQIEGALEWIQQFVEVVTD